VIGGERTKLQAAHTKLAHSRAFIVRAYPLQTHEMLFDALTQAFRVRGIFDNMKTSVDWIGSGKARQVNARFSAMASHYLFEVAINCVTYVSSMDQFEVAHPTGPRWAIEFKG
jgi:transposase